MPKMYSLYSEASMFPRRSSQARKSRPESWDGLGNPSYGGLPIQTELFAAGGFVSAAF